MMQLHFLQGDCLSYSNLLIQPLLRATLAKRFIAVLTVGITALIGVITSFAFSTPPLVKESHTAHHVDLLSKNMSIALVIQENIDRGFQDKLQALEEAVLFMGNQIQNIKIRPSA